MESDIQRRFEHVLSGVDKLKNYRSFINSQIDSTEQEISKCQYKAELLQTGSELFKNWLENSIKQNVDSISDLVTSGLNQIIFDQNLK